MHIAQSIDLLSVHGYNFVNFRKIVEMLLSCTGGPGDKKHSLYPDQEDMNFYLYYFIVIISIAVLHYDLVP